MDRFFDGAFLTFGLEVIAFAEQDQEDRLDPLIYVFPRMTKVRSSTFTFLFIFYVLFYHVFQVNSTYFMFEWNNYCNSDLFMYQ